VPSTLLPRHQLVIFFFGGVSVDAIDVIVECCPDLQYLDVWMIGVEDELDIAAAKIKLKSGLKRLSKLKVNGEFVQLGTDWKGPENGGLSSSSSHFNLIPQ
jgi:hypothetical protein